MAEPQIGPKVDKLTVIGIALALLPLLTMWHEIGGHALSCIAQGGKVSELGAFYAQCSGLDFWPDWIVACAGAAMDAALAVVAWVIWKRVRGDLARLIWWYVATSKGFVAAGYLLFSGVTGIGDFGTGPGGGWEGMPNHPPLRIGLVVIGGLAYWWLYGVASRNLAAMIGQGEASKTARRTIAHLFYATIGVCAVFVGLFNPVGIFITIMSAAASSFGGNAGLISVGYATKETGEALPFSIARNWPLLAVGMAISIAFGVLLGPSVKF